MSFNILPFKFFHMIFLMLSLEKDDEIIPSLDDR